MKPLLLFIALIFLVGCQNPGVSRFIRESKTGEKVTVEIGAEVQVKRLEATIDSAGNAKIVADDLTTKKVDVIKAEAAREAQNIKATGDTLPKAGEAVGTGAAAFIKKTVAP